MDSHGLSEKLQEKDSELNTAIKKVADLELEMKQLHIRLEEKSYESGQMEDQQRCAEMDYHELKQEVSDLRKEKSAMQSKYETMRQKILSAQNSESDDGSLGNILDEENDIINELRQECLYYEKLNEDLSTSLDRATSEKNDLVKQLDATQEKLDTAQDKLVQQSKVEVIGELMPLEYQDNTENITVIKTLQKQVASLLAEKECAAAPDAPVTDSVGMTSENQCKLEALVDEVKVSELSATAQGVMTVCDGEVAQLRTCNEELEHCLQRIKEEYNNSKGKIQNLEEMVKKLEESNIQLQHSTVNAELEHSSTPLETGKRNIEYVNTDEKEVETQITNLGCTNEDYVKEITALKRQLEEALKCNKELQDKIHGVHLDKADTSASVADENYAETETTHNVENVGDSNTITTLKHEINELQEQFDKVSQQLLDFKSDRKQQSVATSDRLTDDGEVVEVQTQVPVVPHINVQCDSAVVKDTDAGGLEKVLLVNSTELEEVVSQPGDVDAPTPSLDDLKDLHDMKVRLQEQTEEYVSLKELYHNLKHKHDTENDAIAHLQDQVNATIGGGDTSKEEHKSSKTLVKQLTADVVRLNEEVGQLSNSLELVREERDQAKCTVDELQSQFSNIETGMDEGMLPLYRQDNEMITKLNDSETKVDSLLTINAKLSDEHVISQDCLEKQRLQCTEAEKQVIAQQESIDKLTAELMQLRDCLNEECKTHANVKSKLEESLHVQHGISKELEEEQRKIADLESCNANLLEDIKCLKESNETLKIDMQEKLESGNVTIDETTLKYQLLQQDVIEKESTIHKITEDCQTYQSENEIREQIISELKGDLEKMQTDKESDLIAHQTELKERDMKVDSKAAVCDELTTAIEHLMQEKVALQEDYDNIKGLLKTQKDEQCQIDETNNKQMTELAESVEKLKASLSDSEKANGEHDKEVTLILKQKEQGEISITELEEIIQDKNRQCSSLEDQFQLQRKELDDANNRVAELSCEVSQLEDDKMHFLNACASKDNMLSNWTEERELTKSKLHEMSTELDNLKSENDHLLHTSNQTKEQAEQDHATMKSVLEQKIVELEAEISKHVEQRDILSAACDESTIEIATLTQQHSELGTDYQNQIDVLIQKSEQLNVQNQTMEDKRQNQCDHIEKLSNDLSELDSSLDEKKKLEQSLRQEIVNISEQCKEMSDANDEQQAYLNDLKMQLAESMEEQSKLAQQVEEFDKSNEQLRNEMESQESEISGMRAMYHQRDELTGKLEERCKAAEERLSEQLSQQSNCLSVIQEIKLLIKRQVGENDSLLGNGNGDQFESGEGDGNKSLMTEEILEVKSHLLDMDGLLVEERTLYNEREDQLSEAMNINMDLEKVVANSEKTCDQYKSEIEQLTRDLQKHADIDKQFQIMKEKYLLTKTEIHSKDENLEAIKSENCAIKQEYNSLMEKNAEMDEKYLSLEKQLSELEKQSNGVSVLVGSPRSAFIRQASRDRSVGVDEENVDHLKDQLQSATNENRRLKERMAILNIRVDKLQKKNKDQEPERGAYFVPIEKAHSASTMSVNSLGSQELNGSTDWEKLAEELTMERDKYKAELKSVKIELFDIEGINPDVAMYRRKLQELNSTLQV